MRTTFLRSLAAGFITSLSLGAAAQTPPVAWAVSTYGPGTTEAFLGCNGCASDQRAMAVDAAGNVFVTGYATTATLSDMMTVKYDGATGAVIWQRTFNDAVYNFHDQAWALALDGAGNAIVTGYAQNGGAETDIKTIKYAGSDGAILWQNTFTGPASGFEFGIAIGVDAAGNVFVGGNVSNGTNDDFKIIKFAAPDGAVLWDRTFPGAAGFNDYAYALAVDTAGNVIVTGEEQQGATDSDWKTVKYAAADGAILWQASYAGAANGLDIPYGMRVDSAGDVVIAGYTSNATDADGKVIKYSGANGGVMWERTFAGASGGADIFYSVALDGAGNALVAGFTFAGAEGNNWIAAKYAAADGSLLWSSTLGGNGNLSDVSVTLAIDAQGNAIVGGRVNNSSDPANRDILVAKFAAADGALAWTYAYAGTAGGFDRVAAVATVTGAVFLAGESLETGFPTGWRVVKLEDSVPRARVGFDFDADARSDILWTNIDGGAAIWLMNGTAPATAAAILGPGTGWAVTHARGDFNADGRSDLVWRHADGAVAIWLMNGLATQDSAVVFGAIPAWSVTHVADLDGDGRSDLIWRNTDGATAAWIMNGTQASSTGTILPAGSPWRVIHTGDFDGDGRQDLLFRHADGSLATWLMDGLALLSSAVVFGPSAAWNVTHVADFSGEGRSDLLFRNSATGDLAIWLMNGTSATDVATIYSGDPGWQVTHVGDTDGDTRADLLWRHSDGRVAIWAMDGLSATSAALLVDDASWSVESLRDFNGDGRLDMLWRHADGRVAIWTMNGTAATAGVLVFDGSGGWVVAPAT